MRQAVINFLETFLSLGCFFDGNKWKSAFQCFSQRIPKGGVIINDQYGEQWVFPLLRPPWPHIENQKDSTGVESKKPFERCTQKSCNDAKFLY
jgi:hypothetical protein